jgi:hypothetical protein
MITTNIDLGQIIISSLLAIIGWFVVRTINQFSKRLDRHDDMLFNLVQDVQFLIGQSYLGRRKIVKSKAENE